MGHIVTFSGPRGVGKTTIMEDLRERYGIQPIIPYTTKNPRPDEVEGREYRFVTDDEFRAVRHTRGMFDVLTLGDVSYGTPMEEFERAATAEGVRTINLAAKSALELRKEIGIDVVRSVFLLPQSWGDIEQQMRDEGIPEEKIVARRAQEPTDLTMLPQFDRLIINGYGNREAALAEAATFIGGIAGIQLVEAAPDPVA